MLVAKLSTVSSELDNWEHGWTGEYSETEWKLEIQGINQKHLLENIVKWFYGIDSENLILPDDGSEEENRIDVQFTTSEEFCTFAIGKEELQQWKEGKIEAYNTTFTFYVIEEKPFKLSKD